MHIVRSMASVEDTTISAIGNIGGIGTLLGNVSGGTRAAGFGFAAGVGPATIVEIGAASANTVSSAI